METPTTPTRQELGKFLPSQRVIRAIEQLFEWIQLLGNPPFGEMYMTNSSVTIAVAAANTPYEVASGLTAGPLNWMAFGGAHYLAPEISAQYLVNWSMGIDTASPLDQIEGGVMLDGIDLTRGTAHTTVPAAGDASTIAGSLIVDAPANSQLSLYVRNHTAARDIEVQHATFTVTMLKPN